jgi:hypothetical protein
MTKGNKPARPVRLLRCREYRNSQALMEQGIAAMVRVSQCDDPALAQKAGQWLVEYGERLLNGKRPAKEETASTDSPSGSPPWRVC